MRQIGHGGSLGAEQLVDATGELVEGHADGTHFTRSTRRDSSRGVAAPELRVGLLWMRPPAFCTYRKVKIRAFPFLILPVIFRARSRYRLAFLTNFTRWLSTDRAG